MNYPLLDAVHRLQQALGIPIDPHDAGLRTRLPEKIPKGGIKSEDREKISDTDIINHGMYVRLSNMQPEARALEHILEQFCHFEGLLICTCKLRDVHEDAQHGVDSWDKPANLRLEYMIIGEEALRKHVEAVDDITALIRSDAYLKAQYEAAMEWIRQQTVWIGDGGYPKLIMDKQPHFALALENVPPDLAKTLAKDIGLGWVGRARLPDTVESASLGGLMGGTVKTGGKNIEIPMDKPEVLERVERSISDYLEKNRPPRNAGQALG